MTTVNQRVKMLMDELGYNQNSFSVALGVIPQTTAKILKGKNRPGYDYLHAIAVTFPTVSIRWLITGEGQMFKRKDRQ